MSPALAIVLSLLIAAAGMLSCTGRVYAAGKDSADKDKAATVPIREVHRVRAGDEKYCFFVTHNVVLTPEDVSEMTDDELTGQILESSGLFIKRTNCRKPSHRVITVRQWERSGKSLFLSDKDIAAIRGAEPVDGEPVKLYMDLRISTGDEDDDIEEIVVQGDATDDNEGDGSGGGSGDGSEDGSGDGSGGEPGADVKKGYSTYKRTSPMLLFVVVATETDAAYGEKICEWETKEDKNKKKRPKVMPDVPGGDVKEKAEILPEYRTISMVDRSGGPLEDTLKDGTPVDLEWIEPAKRIDDGEKRFLGSIPFKAACAIGVIALAAAAAALLAVKRRKS